MDENVSLDFAPNYTHIIELDITPNAPTRNFQYALRGITECVPESDETTNEDIYYHNLGKTETEVESVAISLAMTGHRMYGDPVQDFVQSLATQAGKARKTNFRWTHPDGTTFIGQCTLTELVPGSGMGEANAKGEFTYRININTFTEEYPSLNMTPETITCEDVTVNEEEVSAANAQVLPAKANQKCHYAIEDTTIATVDADGNVTGVAEGTTQMTIKAASKPLVVKQVTVTVSAAG